MYARGSGHSYVPLHPPAAQDYVRLHGTLETMPFLGSRAAIMCNVSVEYRHKAEVHIAILPGEVCEGAFLLLLVEGPQQLQLHLSVLCHKPAILS